jgi:hypothetical protein
MIEVKISSAGGSQPVGFSMKDGCDLSKLKFDKEASCTWLTLSKGTSEISLTATKNERPDSRTCCITPSYDGSVCSKNVFAVTQDGSGEPPTPPTPTTCNVSVTLTGLPDGETANIAWGGTTDTIGNETKTKEITNSTTVNLSKDGYTFDPNNFTLSCEGATATAVTSALFTAFVTSVCPPA